VIVIPSIHASSYDYGSGGQLFNVECSRVIINTIFIGGEAENGGAISQALCSTTILTCFFSGNYADVGGAIEDRSCIDTLRLSAPSSIQFACIEGDASRDGRVNLIDLQAIKAAQAQELTESNFHLDIDAGGGDRTTGHRSRKGQSFTAAALPRALVSRSAQSFEWEYAPFLFLVTSLSAARPKEREQKN
jgi:hypothetical protein